MIKVLISILLLTSSMASARSLDGIVAVVNNEAILESELASVTAQFSEKIAQQAQKPPASVIREQLIDRMVMQRLQLQLAKRRGLVVDDQTLMMSLKRIAEKNKISLREFRDTLVKEGKNFNAFREAIRDEMLISQLRKIEVEGNVVVTEREVESYAQSQVIKQATGSGEGAYYVKHILIAVPDEASDEELVVVKEKLAAVQLALSQSGNSFESVAMRYSDGENAAAGGDIGWRKLDELPDLFVDIVQKSPVGVVSKPLRSNAGFHLLKVTERQNVGDYMVKQILASHILLEINEVVSDADAKSRLEVLRQRVLNGEAFDSLARAHSKDKGSAVEGGSLGWTSPGVMVPEFETVMNNVAVGSVSEVFKSRFGWHLVKVFDRRETDMAEEFKRGQVRNYIRQQKITEAQDAWLQEIRDEAYIELRNN